MVWVTGVYRVSHSCIIFGQSFCMPNNAVPQLKPQNNKVVFSPPPTPTSTPTVHKLQEVGEMDQCIASIHREMAKYLLHIGDADTAREVTLALINSQVRHHLNYVFLDHLQLSLPEEQRPHLPAHCTLQHGLTLWVAQGWDFEGRFPGLGNVWENVLSICMSGNVCNFFAIFQTRPHSARKESQLFNERRNICMSGKSVEFFKWGSITWIRRPGSLMKEET